MLRRSGVSKDDSGVSEVVGSLLTLIITVTIFSGVFAGIQTLEGPQKQSYISFSASAEGTDPYFVNISNEGGGDLADFKTDIYLVVQGGTSYKYNLIDDDSGNDLLDGEWNIGEIMNIRIDGSTYPPLYSEFQDPDSEIDVMVYDNGKNRVLWQSQIKGADILPPMVRDLGVDYSLSWNYYADPGDRVTLWVDIIDKDTLNLDDINVEVNLSDVSGIEDQNMARIGNIPFKENRYEYSFRIPEDQINSTYLLPLNITDGKNIVEIPYEIVLFVGEASAGSEDAELHIPEDKITFTPSFPSTGDNVILKAIVYNSGGTRTEANITFIDTHPDGTNITHPDIKNQTLKFPAGGGRSVLTNWDVSAAGVHEVTIIARYNGEVAYGRKKLIVKPNILIVDDDHVNKGLPGDDVSDMVNAIEAIGNFKYDVFTVTGKNGPEYDSGLYKMQDYDIVIWMTGTKTVNTLTNRDRTELEKLLNNEHKLWLIGEGIGDEALSSSLNNWLRNNLYAQIISTDNAPTGLMTGVDDPLASADMFERKVSPLGNHGDYLSGFNDGYSMLEDAGGDPIAVAYNRTTKTVFQSTMFSNIRENLTFPKLHQPQTRLAFKVIFWMGNITSADTRDLAVSKQMFSTVTPTFKEVVDISAVIRNNGFYEENPKVVLKVDGSIVQEEVITVEGDGGSETVSFNWTAQPVGEHDIKVEVDPYNTIPETNEINNDISYQDVNTIVTVRFSTLIVDDDIVGSSAETVRRVYDNLGYSYEIFNVSAGGNGPGLERMKLYNSICWLTGTDHTDTLTSEDVSNITSYLVDYSEDKNFILIGDGILDDLSSSGIASDINFLNETMKVDTNTISTQFLPDYLQGIDDNEITHGARYYMENSPGNPVDSYQVREKWNGSEMIFRDENDRGLAHMYSSSGSVNYNLVFCGVDISHFESPITAGEEMWYSNETNQLNYSSQSVREEFVYMVNNWFGVNDKRIELRVSDVDINISSEHPILGRSYLIKTRVQNVGGAGSNAMVRFRDGDMHIGTESIFVPANSFSDLEIKWKPLKAGARRTIRVIVDPLEEVPEIPNARWKGTEETEHMSFNNQAITYTPVYYFWDDMEDPELVGRNWDHSANLALINGETPIDFMGGQYTDLDTNVAGDWEDTSGVDLTSYDYHSDPYSYLMYEPVGKIGRKADVFLGIVLDNSHSMSNRMYGGKSWMQHAKDGAISLVNSLSNESVVCVWRYEGINVAQQVPPTQLEGGGRQTVITGINSTGTKPITSIWDATGEAYMDVMNNIGSYPDLMPALTILGDGGDIASADGSANLLMLESGSKNWAPWGDMQPELGHPNQNYPSHLGKYQFPYNAYTPSDDGTWRRASGPQYSSTRKGLLHSDIPIYTIGLAVEHFDNIPNWDQVTTNTLPIDGDVNQYHVYKHSSGTNAQENKEAATLEYNLWRIANTSGAEYFFAPDPGDLEDIFENISQMLSGPQNLSSDGGGNTIKSSGGDGLMASDLSPSPTAKNSDKWAVTPTLDLTNMSSAWLTFWQKYRLIQGVNGAYIEIGYYNDTISDWSWRYVQPSIGPYTGNLLLDNLPSDSFNNTIEWCWNGKSAGGTLKWEYVKVNLLKDEYNIPADKYDEIRVRFYYKQFGGATVPGGWFIDDVNVVASREDNWEYNINDYIHDVWHLKNTTDRNGDATTAWWNGDPTTGTDYFRGGIDNRLTTSKIDLTNAKTANMSAYFKFNINTANGRPPDGFRVEITTDNGRTWETINLGVRTASDVSSGAGNHWTSAGDLSRLYLDLSDYAGNTVMLRFRVVTCSAPAYDHYEVDNNDGGFYVDDVVVYGETL